MTDMIIRVEDYPTVDPDTEDGKQELTHIAMMWHCRDDKLKDFVFTRRNKEIGRLIVTESLIAGVDDPDETIH